MSIVRAPRAESHFTTLRNDVIRDERLSYRASGVLIDILSRPDNWRTSSEQISRARHREGREAIRKALRELQAAGYLVHVKKRDPKTGRLSTVSYVFDEPRPTVDEDVLNQGKRRTPPGPKNPYSGEPDAGQPDAGFSGPNRRTVTKDCEEEPKKKDLQSSYAPSSSSSSSSPRPLDDEDDEAVASSKSSTKKAAKVPAARAPRSQAKAASPEPAAAKQRTARRTRKAADEELARRIIAEHGGGNYDAATALLTRLREDGVKQPGAYLRSVVDNDGEDKAAEMVADAEDDYSNWIHGRANAHQSDADHIANELASRVPLLVNGSLERVRDAIAVARACGWKDRDVEVVNDVLRGPNWADPEAYATALEALGVRVS